MIVTNPFFDRVGVSQKLAAQTTLSQEQVTALTEELAKPEYEGLSLSEILVELNQQLVGDNPTPQGRVPRTIVPQAEYIVLINRIILRGDQLTGAAAEAWQRVKSAAEGMRFQVSVNLEDPDVMLGVRALTQLGLLALQPGETISLGELLTTAPDPDYIPRLTLPSIAETVTGVTGAMLTPSDLEGLI